MSTTEQENADDPPRPPRTRIETVGLPPLRRGRARGPGTRARSIAPISREELELRRREVQAASDAAAAAANSAAADLRAAEAQEQAARAQIEALSVTRAATRAQRRGVFVQALATMVAAVAAIAAVVAVNTQAEGVNQQSEASRQSDQAARLETAMTSIREGDAAGRVGGLTLLVSHVSGQLEYAAQLPRPTDEGELRTWGQVQADAVTLHASALDTVEMYLRDANRMRDAAGGTSLGIGQPQVPSDIGYAVNRLKALLDLAGKANEVNSRLPESPGAGGPLPTSRRSTSVDLSGSQLFGAPLRAIDFSALVAAGGAARFEGADLRGSEMRLANLDRVKLPQAFLQCSDFAFDKKPAVLTNADLSGADLRGANLEGADMRGADLQNTDLRGANLAGADLTGASVGGALVEGSYGSPRSGAKLSVDTNAGPYTLDDCTSRQEYWRSPGSAVGGPMIGLAPRQWVAG